ncbi:hypothetical protein D3C73_1156990 [compost metagenome]
MLSDGAVASDQSHRPALSFTGIKIGTVVPVVGIPVLLATITREQKYRRVDSGRCNAALQAPTERSIDLSFSVVNSPHRELQYRLALPARQLHNSEASLF